MALRRLAGGRYPWMSQKVPSEDICESCSKTQDRSNQVLRWCALQSASLVDS